MFSKILIANRGEIALRIIRACREMGIQTAIVYSTADKDAAYLKLADQAICIGDAPPAESYLNIPRIISAAEIADVQAIHPGYGFLAENDHFAEICRSCKIEFIGPPVKAMAAVGGGRGMRVAHNDVSLRAGFRQAQAEAENAFKDSTVYIEKYVEFGRHVEVQVLADHHGNVVHLWERDCSMQRRHQKLVEESPSPALSAETRKDL